MLNLKNNRNVTEQEQMLKLPAITYHQEPLSAVDLIIQAVYHIMVLGIINYLI